MRVKVLPCTVRTLVIFALGSVFFQPLCAQQTLYLPIQRSEDGQSPISFMRPHYFIHQASGAGLTSPPISAFQPVQIRHAYGFDLVSDQGAGQTIALVDAYDDPNAESDLAVFSQQFKLPVASTSNGFFRKVYATGHKPAANANWSVEISLDVEWAHAIAPKATIILVEAASNNLSDLLKGVDVAVRNGATLVSMSWDSGEFSGERNSDNHFVTNGVTFLAASGDSGTGVTYPAASPDVIGVGGTSLTLDSNGNYLSETAWSGSGGGLSAYEHQPLYQAQFGIPDDSRGLRGVPDVSYNANPGTGYAVYDSVAISGASGWFQIGGTSAATPQWAATIAIANSTRAGLRKTNLSSADTALYSLAEANLNSHFHSVTQGENGSCGALCDALAGYDFVTGLGTPRVNVLVPALVSRP
ncbi:MAG TPA: S53 family peptidase [Candidatus Binatus sp.]|jgi:subtilase family serine protease|nr:S53 family peptidase [Candidatus Binatus sp.]